MCDNLMLPRGAKRIQDLGPADGIAADMQCPRTFYTDLDTLICKTLPQTDLRGEQYTSRLCDPAIAWHAPHGADQRQRKQHQLGSVLDVEMD